MPSELSYAFAFLLGTFLECVMYGIFFALFLAACYVQWDRYSQRRGVNRVVAFTTVFFWLTITTNCVLSVYRSIQAILYTSEGVTFYEYLDPPYPAGEIFRMGLFQFQIIVADVIMALRMYHIYEKNPFICIIPSISIPALFAVTIALTNQLRDLSTPHDQKMLGDLSTACFCLTIFNSLFITIAISFRLWRVHHETTRANIRLKGSLILRAMKVLIESAALWTAFVFMNFLTSLAKSNLVYMFLAMTGPAVGISFCLIIVRMGLILPESRDESWHLSVPTPGTRTPGSVDQPASVFPSDSKVNQSDDPPKVVPTSLRLPSPTT